MAQRCFLLTNPAGYSHISGTEKIEYKQRCLGDEILY